MTSVCKIRKKGFIAFPCAKERVGGREGRKLRSRGCSEACSQVDMCSESPGLMNETQSPQLPF